MTVKELAAGLALFAGAVTGSAAVVGWVDARYMDAIHAARLDAKIYHLDAEIIDLTGVKALYEGRLQDNGALTPADQNRYQTVVSKINAATRAKQLLEQELAGL